jgi:hypothetical protein
MSADTAISILVEHRNNICNYSVTDINAAKKALHGVKLSWVQLVNGTWILTNN